MRFGSGRRFGLICLMMCLCAAPAFAGLQLNKNSLDFGNVSIGATPELSFTITNTFSTPTAVTLTRNGDFFLLLTISGNLAPNETKTVGVRISDPRTVGLQSGSIQISGGGANKTVAVTAKIINPFETKIEPPAVDFGSVAVGANKELTVKFRNKTNKPLTYTFGVPEGQPFSLTPASKTVAGGDSMNLKITFTPTVISQIFSIPFGFTIATSTGASTKGKLLVSATGAAPPVSITLNPTALNFGDVDRGTGKQLSVTVKNDSARSADFKVGLTGNFVVSTAPFTLEGGQEKVVNVNIEAGAAPGNITGALRFTSGTTTATVNLTAKVFDPLGTQIGSQLLDFGTVNTGQTKSKSFTVKNTSPGTLSYSTTSNPSLYTGSPATLSLSAGQTGTLTITFNPGSAKGNLPGVTEVRANNSIVGSVNLKANVP